MEETSSEASRSRRPITFLFAALGWLWALSLGVSALGVANRSAPVGPSRAVRGDAHSLFSATFVLRPHVSQTQEGSEPTTSLVDRDETITEAPNVDDLDGDDDDPVELPSRTRALGLCLVIVPPSVSDPSLDSAPDWLCNAFSRSQVRSPLRC
jgi:hypothetical protein